MLIYGTIGVLQTIRLIWCDELMYQIVVGMENVLSLFLSRKGGGVGIKRGWGGGGRREDSLTALECFVLDNNASIL